MFLWRLLSVKHSIRRPREIQWDQFIITSIYSYNHDFFTSFEKYPERASIYPNSRRKYR